MRLLILTPELCGSGGGIKTFYRHLLPHLRERGVTIRVIEGSASYTAMAANVVETDGMTVETLELPRLQRHWRGFSALESMPGLRMHFAAAWAMWEQAQFGSEADVVEATDWGLLFLPPALERTVPLVVQTHGSIGQIAAHDPIRGEEAQSAFAQLIERAVMSQVSEVQSYSHANAGFWLGETGRPATMIRSAWSPPVQATGSPPDGRGLVIGRVQRWKGPATLCQAQRLLGDRGPAIDWIGRDTLWESRFRTATSHLAEAFPSVWGRTVRHHPQVDQEEVARRQAGALFNLVPSTWDVFNFTAVEAMASGRPTIVSSGAGASELVEDGENGFVFPADDPQALASAIDRVLTAPTAALDRIGRNGAETVRRELDPEKIAEARVSAYEAVAARFAQASAAPVGGWLREICTPREPADATPMPFLDQQPLSGIVRHVRRRMVRKIGLS